MDEITADFRRALAELPEALRSKADDRRSFRTNGRWTLCDRDGNQLKAQPAATRAAPQQATRALPESLARTMPGRETPGEIQALRKFAAANRVRLVFDQDAGRWVAR